MTSDQVIQGVLAKVGGGVPATKLVKLVYLVDYVHYQHFGETVTGLDYQWDHYGPNAVQHGIVSAAERLAEENQITYTRSSNQYGGVTKYFSTIPGFEMPTLDAKAEMVMNDVVDRYGHLSVKKITTVSKQTSPFKNASQYDMLTMEQSAPALIAFAPSSRRFLDSMPNHIRSKLIHDAVWLTDNLHLAPDNQQIVPFLMAPVVGKLFKDDFHWIIFYTEKDRLIIANIGAISEIPHLWRE